MSSEQERCALHNDKALTCVPETVADALFSSSEPVDAGTLEIQGGDWTQGPPDMETFLASLRSSAFQATQLGLAIEEVRRMRRWRPSDDDVSSGNMTEDTRCTIWLSFTSNLMNSGLREVFLYLVKNQLINVVVTSAGAIEADLLRCLSPTYVGSFHADGSSLRRKGWNKIGNVLVPNQAYITLRDWLQPVLTECLHQMRTNGTEWTPSRLIQHLGMKINDPRSVLYWCYKNNIPVFCPGITDGALGINLYYHSHTNPGLVIDVVQDIRRINDIAVRAKKSGMIILGGGIGKHHTCNANLMRNGADFAVYINTGQEFDGCDSGARPDEAVSWGKIRADACPVKVCCDASIAFPLLVAAAFRSEP